MASRTKTVFCSLLIYIIAVFLDTEMPRGDNLASVTGIRCLFLHITTTTTLYRYIHISTSTRLRILLVINDLINYYYICVKFIVKINLSFALNKQQQMYFVNYPENYRILHSPNHYFNEPYKNTGPWLLQSSQRAFRMFHSRNKHFNVFNLHGRVVTQTKIVCFLLITAELRMC